MAMSGLISRPLIPGVAETKAAFRSLELRGSTPLDPSGA